MPTSNDVMFIRQPYRKTPVFATTISEINLGGLGTRREANPLQRYRFSFNLRYRLKADALAFLDWFEIQQGKLNIWTFQCLLDDDLYDCRFTQDHVDLVWQRHNLFTANVSFIGTEQT
jgi:hypothetical protein